MRVILVLVGMLIATPVVAQHKQVVEAVKAELVASGENLQGPCGAFKITQRVVWRLRDTGIGLINKTPNQNGCSVDAGRFAVDAAAYHDGLACIDMLVNSETENRPAWNSCGTIASVALWHAPVDPGDTMTPVPDPVPTPTPTPVPAPLPSVDLTPILLRLDVLEAAIQAVNQNVDDGRKENQAFYREVGNQWKRVTAFAGKYVAPALVAYLIGNKIAQ